MVGPLMNDKGETVKDPFQMAEILRKQYESAFSIPDPDYNIDTVRDFFEEGEEREGEKEREEERGEEGEEEKEEREEEGQEEGQYEEGISAHAPDMDGLPTVGAKPQLKDAHFDHMDISEAIDALSLGGGPGPDGISPILLKKSKLTVSLMLYSIFYSSIQNGEIPDKLKLGYICPILKTDSKRENPASWRPVSLTSHVVKTLERVLRKQIVNHLEENNLMDPDQHGSRRSRSCLSQLLEHHDEVLKLMEDGGNIDVIYADFAKAYDKIDHLKMLEKMKNQFGISGKVGNWIKNFLQNRKQQVLIEETASEKSKVLSGSIQGSVIGPVLFLMYIRDISKQVSANTKVFVDDTKMKDSIKNEDDVEKLQGNLDKLFEWQTENNMLLNGSKFQILRYGPYEQLNNDTLYFTDNTENIIDRFSTLRDLGVILSDDGRFDSHIEKVSQKVRQKVGWILRSFYTRRTDHLKHLWKTLVQCHIDYCSQLYLPGQARGKQEIEKLFYNFTSKIPQVREVDYWSRLRILKMYSQERRMERYRIVYIWKILEGLVPNCGVECEKENARLGRKVKIPSLSKTGRQAVQTLREASFQINGARLFNCLPKKVRETRIYQDEFKEALDDYLSTVPDQPRIGSLVPTATDRLSGRQSNSLLAWANSA